MKIYLSGPKSEKANLLNLAEKHLIGEYSMSSSWVNSIVKEDNFSPNENAQFAWDNFMDVAGSDMIVHFVDGDIDHEQFVNFGIAMALGKPQVVVGKSDIPHFHINGVIQVESFNQIFELM